MSDYKRFVSYLYEYISDKKANNRGFVKVELRSGSCRLQFQLNVRSIPENTPITIYGYIYKDGDLNGYPLGKLNAIKKASRKLGDWRLEGCTMYVTLEPCQMCAGAMVQSRIDEVVIGCMNSKAGCAGSVLNLLQVPTFNHQVKITSGVLNDECSEMMSGFFQKLREKKKAEKAAKKEERNAAGGE